MDAFISKITDWLKLSPKYLFPISLVTGFIIFTTNKTLEVFGIVPLITQIRPYLGIIFLISSALLASHILFSLLSWINKKIQRILFILRLPKRLLELTNDEKNILLYYISNQTKTQHLSTLDGVVSGLEINGIIFKSSNWGHSPHDWSYNIQPWAWEYLNKHKDLLKRRTIERLEE